MSRSWEPETRTAGFFVCQAEGRTAMRRKAVWGLVRVGCAVVGGASALLAAETCGLHAQGPVVPMGRFHHCGDDGSTTLPKVKAFNRLKNRAIEPTLVNHAVTLEQFFAPGDDRHRFNENDGAVLRGLVV